jgi:hypothetical protein
MVYNFDWSITVEKIEIITSIKHNQINNYPIDMVIVFYKISINNYKSKEIRILLCTKRSRRIYNNNYSIIIMLKNTVVVSSEEIIPRKYLNTIHYQARSISTYHLLR